MTFILEKPLISYFFCQNQRNESLGEKTNPLFATVISDGDKKRLFAQIQDIIRNKEPLIRPFRSLLI